VPLYLWISTFCRFSRGSWRWAGYEIAAACLFQALSFVWFATDLCHQNHCSLSNGAKADIMAATFWLVAAILVFAHYPIPKELVAADSIMNENSESSRGSSQRSTQRRRSKEFAATVEHDTAVFENGPAGDVAERNTIVETTVE
jgi:hypothetical protein